jgi:hypothetical protein
MNDDTKTMIGASLRTLLVGMPSIPAGPNPFAMVAQAWSEYEGHKFKQRVEEFVTAIHARLTSLESLQVDHLSRVLDLEEQAALLEEAVAAASREPKPEKRQAFAGFYVAAITGKLGSDPDPVRSLLQTLEALTFSDVKILKVFGRYGTTSGDVLSGTPSPGLLGGSPRSESEWEQLLAPIQLSIVKLETRGLILPTARRSGFAHQGDSSSWFNRFREKAWRITQPGRQLLTAISTDH